MNETPAIFIKDLEKSYGDVRALRDVDITVMPGEMFGFLGPNGAGKTTTIRCLLDMIRPDAGTLRVLGLDPQKDPTSVHAQTGYLPGELNLEANMKVLDAFRYFTDLRGNQIDRAHVRLLANKLELDLKMPIKNLSKGNKQKVGIVQALMHRPKLLLMDEPTSGLDPLMQQVVYQLLREAQANGSTVFFSSHIISEVEALADKVAIIRAGVIVQEASPSHLTSMALRRVHMRFKEAVDLTPLSQVDGVTLLSRTDGTGATFQVAGEMEGLVKALATYPVSDIETERPSLEELFLTYYEADKKEAV